MPVIPSANSQKPNFQNFWELSSGHISRHLAFLNFSQKTKNLKKFNMPVIPLANSQKHNFQKSQKFHRKSNLEKNFQKRLFWLLSDSTFICGGKNLVFSIRFFFPKAMSSGFPTVSPAYDARGCDEGNHRVGRGRRSSLVKRREKRER